MPDNKEVRDLSELSNEELRRLTDVDGPIGARWCARCDKHYRFCRCDEPRWVLRVEGHLEPLPGAEGARSITLQQLIYGKEE
jgi:hypothetical protein